MGQVGVERWRLLGREVRVIDHEISEQQRRRRKELGQDLIQTAQGFNLTEDQYYLREEWPLPDAQLLKDYEDMPNVFEIAEELASKGLSTEEDLRQGLSEKSPQCLKDELAEARKMCDSEWDPNQLRNIAFPPHLENITQPPECPPGYIQLEPRSSAFVDVWGEVGVWGRRG